jgi:hypothetical protein
MALLFIAAAIPGEAGAQVEREVREPLAPGLGIVEVTPDLRQRLGLFPDVQGFSAARLLRRTDDVPILEIEIAREGVLERERRVLNAAELDAFRLDLEQRFASLGGAVPLAEGRGGFVLGHTLLGLGFHGWALPYALDLNSARAGVATYLLTAGASFYLPYRISRERTVTEVHRDLSLYGGTRGILAGMLLGDAVVDQGGNSVGRARVAGGLTGSLLGSTAGFLAAGRAMPDPGRAALWSAMGDLGFLAGAAAAYAGGPYASRDVEIREGDLVYTDSQLRNRALGHAITVAGGAGGLAAGAWLGGRSSYTEGNVGALRSSGILGAQVGATLTRGVGVDQPRPVIAGALAGGITGIILGDRLLQGRSLSQGEGLLVNAGHIAGGATALGLTWLAVEEIDDHPVLYLVTSTVGSLLGAGLVYRAVDEPGSSAASGFGTGSGRSADLSSRLRAATVSVNPENLLISGLSGGSGVQPVLSVRF